MKRRQQNKLAKMDRTRLAHMDRARQLVAAKAAMGHICDLVAGSGASSETMRQIQAIAERAVDTRYDLD